MAGVLPRGRFEWGDAGEAGEGGQLMQAEPLGHVGSGAVVVRDQRRDQHMNLVADVVELDAFMPERSATTIPKPALVVAVGGL